MGIYWGLYDDLLYLINIRGLEQKKKNHADIFGSNVLNLDPLL
jgi:hypothetical protein